MPTAEKVRDRDFRETAATDLHQQPDPTPIEWTAMSTTKDII
jgi:hypothetical protein